MEQKIKAHLKIMVFKHVYPLVEFYRQFVIDGNKIFLGTHLKSNSSSVSPDDSKYLLPANINTVKTQKGLLMLVWATFNSDLDTVIKWLEFIHDSFPNLDFYLTYYDFENEPKGEVFTKIAKDSQEKGCSSFLLEHILIEQQWYNLEHQELLTKLEQGLFRTKNNKIE
jgi:hypothetical protein